MTAFHNDALDIANLPHLGSLETKPMARKYLHVQIAATSAFVSIFALVLSLVRFQPFVALPPLHRVYPYLLAGLGGIYILLLTYQILATPRKRYALREQDLHYQSGLIFRKWVSQPILRIQHIEIKRGPFDRLFGIASLHVFSAGGAAHTLIIPGLEYERSAQIRQYILTHRDSHIHG